HLWPPCPPPFPVSRSKRSKSNEEKRLPTHRLQSLVEADQPHANAHEPMATKYSTAGSQLQQNPYPNGREQDVDDGCHPVNRRQRQVAGREIRRTWVFFDDFQLKKR